MVDPDVAGKQYAPFSFTIERGKLREFLLAIGEDDPRYTGDDPPLPPTFATTFLLWGGGGLEDALGQIGVQMWNVLHTEQAYTYHAPLHVGDTVTGQTHISAVTERAGMQFVEFVTEYANQHGLPVLTDRAVLLVRE